ncbi:tetratricopeptide repeat protein [Micromonospora pisi]|uniref:Tetratricopeptide repeat protein n=1 Tax=Micromonospora pisi TaxID=589240 RepID=A0A495JV74_9ACTN|nr:CHAT domain-containing tetratricopeptide repeat protein [Micromonospora pisi]RKR92927.1 tetratricopeptide repeat protein [Micromonospora pisi]
MTSPLEDLFAAVVARIEAHEQGDSGPLLDDEAVTQSGALYEQATGDDGVPLDVVRVLAWLHWYRYLALPEGPDQEDLNQALALFAAIADVDPEAVPPPVARYLASGGYPEQAAGGPAALQLLHQAMSTDDEAALDRAVEMLTAAAEQTPAGAPDLVVYLINLNIAMQLRYERSGALEDIDAAVHFGRLAVAQTSPDHEHRAACLSNLGNALRSRYARAGVAADLDDTIVAARQALDALAADDPNANIPLSVLSPALLDRFQLAGAADDLTESVELARRAVAATPADHPHGAAFRSNLAAALQVRYERSGGANDLDEAIDAAREALRDPASDASSTGGRWSNLSNLLRLRFQRTGSAADLDESVHASRRAVAATEPAHPMLMETLSSLGAALQLRFFRNGSLQDLDEAVDAARRAVELTPPDHPDRPGRLSNLSNGLRQRFEWTGSTVDLDGAVTAAREATQGTPSTSAAAGKHLSNLGQALRVRFEHTRAADDLDEAIAATRRAIDLRRAGDIERGSWHSILGDLLRSRFLDSGAQADLTESISVSRLAVDLFEAGQPDVAHALLTLGRNLLERGTAADLAEALGAFARSTSVTGAPAVTRLVTARLWARTVAQHSGPASALPMYTAAIGLLPLLAWRGVPRADLRHLVRTAATTLGCEAAACAIDAGRPDVAVELLEQGRGILWAQLLDTRTDLDALRQAHPELAAGVARCRDLLDAPSADTGISSDALMRAAQEFDDLVERVRALPPTPEFPRPAAFLRPPALRELTPDSDAGPVIILNVSRWRCDALIVTAAGVVTVPLPDLTEDAVLHAANRYLNALQLHESNPPGPVGVLTLERAITSALEWLWDSIAGPVLDALGHAAASGTEPPRVWWCPTGALTVLPLHAAGHHAGEAGNTVIDRVISSYTPTLRALAHARSRDTPMADRRLLVVALPDTPGHPPLPGAATEQRLLSRLLPEQRRTILAGHDATHDAVTAALTRHRWVHASCHGTQNLTDPSLGGLVPHDWRANGLIGPDEFARARHNGGEFAFLSACKTATPAITDIDEAITLVTAMQYAGWRHVIGTLWSVWDHTAVEVAQGVYAAITTTAGIAPERSSHALHAVVRGLRDRQPRQPTVWAPFIHAGL